MSILEWAKKEVALANRQDGTTTSTENELPTHKIFIFLPSRQYIYKLFSSKQR